MSDWKCQGVEDGTSGGRGWSWGWGGVAAQLGLGLGSCCSAKYVKMSFNRKGTKHAHGSICVVMVLKSLAFIQIIHLEMGSTSLEKYNQPKLWYENRDNT